MEQRRKAVENSQHKRRSFGSTFDAGLVSRAENKLIQRQRGLEIPVNVKGLKGNGIDRYSFNSQCLSSIRNSWVLGLSPYMRRGRSSTRSVRRELAECLWLQTLRRRATYVCQLGKYFEFPSNLIARHRRNWAQRARSGWVLVSLLSKGLRISVICPSNLEDSNSQYNFVIRISWSELPSFKTIRDPLEE